MVNILKITSKYIKLHFGCKHAKHKIKIDNLIFFNIESNETISKKILYQVSSLYFRFYN
jgi:hypothetical protein